MHSPATMPFYCPIHAGGTCIAHHGGVTAAGDTFLFCSITNAHFSSQLENRPSHCETLKIYHVYASFQPTLFFLLTLLPTSIPTLDITTKLFLAINRGVMLTVFFLQPVELAFQICYCHYYEWTNTLAFITMTTSTDCCSF